MVTLHCLQPGAACSYLNVYFDSFEPNIINYYHLFSAINISPSIPAVTVVVIVIVVVIIVIAIGVTAKPPSVAGPIPIISRLFLLFLDVCREFITMEPDSDSVESYSSF